MNGPFCQASLESLTGQCCLGVVSGNGSFLFIRTIQRLAACPHETQKRTQAAPTVYGGFLWLTWCSDTHRTTRTRIYLFKQTFKNKHVILIYTSHACINNLAYFFIIAYYGLSMCHWGGWGVSVVRTWLRAQGGFPRRQHGDDRPNQSSLYVWPVIHSHTSNQHWL